MLTVVISYKHCKFYLNLNTQHIISYIFHFLFYSIWMLMHKSLLPIKRQNAICTCIQFHITSHEYGKLWNIRRTIVVFFFYQFDITFKHLEINNGKGFGGIASKVSNSNHIAQNEFVLIFSLVTIWLILFFFIFFELRFLAFAFKNLLDASYSEKWILLELWCFFEFFWCVADRSIPFYI